MFGECIQFYREFSLHDFYLFNFFFIPLYAIPLYPSFLPFIYFPIFSVRTFSLFHNTLVFIRVIYLHLFSLLYPPYTFIYKSLYQKILRLIFRFKVCMILHGKHTLFSVQWNIYIIYMYTCVQRYIHVHMCTAIAACQDKVLHFIWIDFACGKNVLI